MLSRLALVVTHRCNLRCRYCYADGGHYGLPSLTMPPKLATDIFNHFVDHFDGVKEIFFFGGEPLIAVHTIEAVCRQAKALVDNGTLQQLPSFIVVTNGTLIKEKFLGLAKQYHFSITVSVDGPSAIHDLNRRTVSGKPSFQRVLKGIDRLKTHNLRFALECTYTHAHRMAGYSPIEIYEYLKSLGGHSIILTDEMPLSSRTRSQWQCNESDTYHETIDFYRHVTEDANRDNHIRDAGLEKMCETLFTQPTILEDAFCHAGLSYFAVNPTGQTYPCHILNNQPVFCLGDFQEITKPIRIMPTKNDFQSCRQCPVNHFCRQCPARMYVTREAEDIAPSAFNCQCTMAVLCIARAFLARKAADISANQQLQSA